MGKRPVRRERRRPAVRTMPALVRVLVPAAMIAVLADADAGYFPTTWGWATLVLALAAAALLFVTGRAGSAWGVALLAAMVAVVAWSALSLAWSISVPRTVGAVQLG